MMIKRSGFRAGSGRPKNMWIRWIHIILTYAKVVKVLLRVAEEAEGEAGVQLADVEAARPHAVEAPVHPFHLPHPLLHHLLRLLPLHKLRLLALLYDCVISFSQFFARNKKA
jgi:hypothetical protein